MSCPPPLQSPKRQVGFGSTYEREFCKYLPRYHLSLPLSQHITADSSCPHVARPCPDTVLTAFAQLGALRLSAERVFISLFGKDNQHILAEASRTLSLQDDNEFEEDDELWMGCSTIAYERSFCKNVHALPHSPRSWEERVFVVPDLQEDDRFSEAVDVKHFPYVRFLACVPIISPKGLAIGAYTVMDTKPRAPLDKKTIKFLTDMSVTIMSHLDINRSKARHLRSERMMVGLGSFLEGKASLRNSWLESSEHAHIGDSSEPSEGHVNARQQAKQALDDSERTLQEAGFGRRLPIRPRKLRPSDDQNIRPPGKLLLDGVKAGDSTNRSHSVPAWSSVKELPDQDTTTAARRHDTYDTEVRRAFSRAANIVRESITVEGTVFFDANFASHGGLVDNARSETDYSDTDSALTSDDNGTANGVSSTRRDSNTSSIKDDTNPCNILGFSTTSASSIDELVGDRRMSLSEAFMKGLLHRYPRGKIFNFAEDGRVSSDDTSDAQFKNFKADSLRAGLGSDGEKRGRRYKKTRKSVIRQDVYTLRQFAPGSRSIIFAPLWDSHKGRWYSGCLVWTKTPLRVFTRDDELTFLFAFGHSVMAEVHRLGSELAERAKSDLLASISHELRSPLHGVLGTAELLAETNMNAFQLGMVHTIESCASTLFDSINHLLEYANINNMRKGRPLGKSYSNGGYFSVQPNKWQREDVEDQEGPVNSLNSTIQLDATLEEVVESVFAGYAFLNGSRSSLRKTSAPSGILPVVPTLAKETSNEVKLVLDINHAVNWKFVTQAGAWRLILMNILGNALKFTQEGLVHVTLDASPIDADQNSSADAMSQIRLTVKDTGSGISEKYLQDEIFGAFSKEDPLTPGTGLGLNVTYRTVAALGGDIQVNSQNGLGTEVITKVPLPHSLGAESEHVDSMSPIIDSKELVRGRSIGILGMGQSEQDKLLRSSARQLCQGWFDLNIVELDPLHDHPWYCDFYITTQEYMEVGNLRTRFIAPGPTQQFTPPLIVICSSPEAARDMHNAVNTRGDPEVVEFISQPCGPRKLAKTLKTCCDRQGRRQSRPEAENDAPVPLGRDEKPAQPPIPQRASEAESTLKGFDVKGPDVSSRDLSHSQSEDNSPGYHQESSPSVPSRIPGSIPPTITLSTSTPRILIVDDNEINVKLLQAYMRKLSCEYSIARNGLEAYEAFKADPGAFGIILMDISMPVMDGLESTRQIREFEKQLSRQTSVTIIALTGLAQAEVHRDAIASGMDIFLTKPVRLKSLQPVFEERGVLLSPGTSIN